MNTTLASFTDVLVDEICNSQPLSLSSSVESRPSTDNNNFNEDARVIERPPKGTGQRGQFRSTEEVDPKFRDVFSYPYFNLVQSSVIEDSLYSDKSIVVCAPTGSGKTVVFEMAIVQLLMELEEKHHTEDFKIIYMAPVKALCTERLTEWYPKFTRLGLLCIEVTGDTEVDFTQLKPYKIIITTPEKWDMLTRRWRDHRGLVEVIKLFLIDEVHILNDETRGPVLEAVVSRMKTIENSAQSVHRIEQLQKEIQGQTVTNKSAPRIRFVAVSATVSNPEDVANWLGTSDKPAVFYKFGDECRPVKLNRIVEGYPCSEGTSIFKFDIILNYKLWPIIQKYHSGKPTLIFCNTRKSVVLTAETLSRELTISFNAEQKAKLTAIASSIKNKKLQALVMSGVGCHHAGLLYEERQNIEFAFRNRDLPILITTTTLAMGVNLPAHLVIVKNTQQYVKGAYQEYSISTVLQMVGRAGRPQFDTEATAVIMTRLVDKPRYQALVGGCEPLQSYLHKRLAENLNSEAALGTVGDVAQCVQWLRSTFLYVRAARDPKKYLGLPQNSPQHLISKKIEELCVKAMNGLASTGLITMDEASCIESTEAGRLMSVFYLDLETMKQIMKFQEDAGDHHGLSQATTSRICARVARALARHSASFIKMPNTFAEEQIMMREFHEIRNFPNIIGCIDCTHIKIRKSGGDAAQYYINRKGFYSLNVQIEGTESLERLLVLICESHELADMHLRMDERRCLNLLNRNNSAATIRFPMKGKISTRQMKLNCVIQAVLGCLSIPDPSLNQEAMKIMRIADRVCKCLVTYVTRPDLISQQPQFFTAVLNSILLAKCVAAHLWENSSFVSKQLKGIGPTFSTLLASAGKVNFMLLEESHPRDLERIMNKGPPAGNVVRKQVSLLPKYQLTMIPVDEKTVTVQLVLLNQSHLAENMESLTAGDSHKSYIIVGDSNNNLLLLAAFKDRDLISVFDGIITHEIRRKHNFEHKIFAHCVSSTFVGIDVQSEYMFNDLEPFLRGPVPCTETQTNTIPIKKTAERQTCITDTFKQRKRKINPDAIDKSKEKRKRENSLIENFKYLKQSFETASTNVNESMNKRRQNGERLNKNAAACSLSSNTINTSCAVNTKSAKDELNDLSDQNTCYKEMDSDEFIDEEKIYSILNEIENEMGKSKASLENTKPLCNKTYFREKKLNVQNPFSTKLTADAFKNLSVQNLSTKSSSNRTLSAPRKPKPKTTKSNYTFIELLERKLSISDDEDKSEVVQKDKGFSDTIKSHIQKYLTKTQTKTSIHDRNIEMLLDKPDDGLQNDNEKTQQMKPDNLDSDILNSPMHSPCPRYEIKEILGGKKMYTPNSNIQQTKDIQDFIHIQDSKDYDMRTNINNKEKHKFNEVATSHYDTDMKALTPLREIHNIILDDEDSRHIIDNEVKEEDLNDTLILNFDEGSEILTNKENVKREVDNCNEINENDLDDIICVEEYTLKKENNEYHKYVANLDPDVIMISPTEVSDEISHMKYTDMNNQCSNTNEQNLVTECVVTEGSNNNPSYVVLDNKGFQNLYESTTTDTPAKNPCSDLVLKNRTQLIANDRASHNKALAIEDTGHKPYDPAKVDVSARTPCSDLVDNNSAWHDKTLVLKDIYRNLYEHTKGDALAKITRSNMFTENRNQLVENIGRSTRNNQAQSNKSNCYPSVYNDLYPSYEFINNDQNNSSNNNSPNNTEINKQKAEYVKRYTYSTSKIDVCTKQTPGYCVQLIKKVKMDLDITAIVSRKHNSFQNCKSHCEKASSNNKKMKMIELPKLEDTFQNTTEDNNIIINTVDNEIRNISKLNVLSARLPRPEFPAIKNAVKLPNKAIVEDENTSNNLQNINKSVGPMKSNSIMNKKQSISNDTEIQIPEKIRHGELKEQDNQNNNYENTSGKLIEAESGNSSFTGNNKIRNLLQKYSKILAKNAVKNTTPSSSGINRTITCNTPTTVKSQKPFKITDIHKLHATLPETIVNNKREVGNDILQFPKVNRYVEAKNKRDDLNSSRYTQDTAMRPTEQIPENESITDLDLEPIHLPANVDLEPSTDYKIDQSMFNPRTLLQCVTDETDELVPPPPEFCDGMTYSPGYDNAEASMAGGTISERAPHLDISTEMQLQYNESIFDDSCATDLTPSTEIETWNLSEDGWAPHNAMNISPAQSFTVMRKNTVSDDNLLQNSDRSRQGKLGKFRFSGKNRFKMRK